MFTRNRPIAIPETFYETLFHTGINSKCFIHAPSEYNFPAFILDAPAVVLQSADGGDVVGGNPADQSTARGGAGLEEFHFAPFLRGVVSNDSQLLT